MGKISTFAGSHKKPIIAIGLVLLAAIALVVILLVLPQPDAASEKDFSTQELSRMDIEQVVAATGTAKSLDSRSITSKQTEKIATLSVRLGQTVKEGQRLCTFDSSAIDLEIASTQKSLSAAQAQYNEGVVQAKQAITDAKRQLAEDKAQLKKSDPARESTLRADKKAVTAAKNSLRSAKLTDTTSTIQAQLASLRLQKRQTLVKAPIAGTVTALNAKVDGYPEMEAPLFVIEDLSNLEISVTVPEYDAVQLKSGLTAHVTSDALQGELWEGSVKSISPTASETGGNFTVTIKLASPLGGLKSGMSAKVNIICAASANTFALPYGAVVEKSDGTSVIYVQDTAADTAKTEVSWRELPVTTGLETDYYVEVLGSGLAAGLVVNIDPEGLNTDAPDAAIADPFRA